MFAGSLEGEAGVGVSPPTFGANQNTRFTFQLPQGLLPQIPKEHSWSPPPNFSSERAFSPTSLAATDAAGSTRLTARFPARRQNALSQKKRRRESEEENVKNNHGAIIPAPQHNSHGNMTTQQPFVVNVQHARPDLQSILRGILQICFSFCWKALLLYIAVRLIMVLQQDVVERISESSLEINQEIAICALHFKNNLCAANQVPAMIRQCSDWETCMNRSAAVVGRVKVGAELIAEVLNGFVEPISWKALAFIAVLIIVLTYSLALRGRHKTTPETTTNTRPINSQNYQSLVPYIPR
ncbi:Di-sulfide bridge nucleocytoplasmic transport domain containing protein [Amanita muscaria]